MLAALGSSRAWAQQAEKPYFQQQVDVTIHVRLDDQQHFLHGDISMVYINRSPDTLRELYMHLYPNAYVNRNTSFGKQNLENGTGDSFYFSTPQQRGYIDSLAFRINGDTAAYTAYNGMPDVAYIPLKKPLPPGGKMTVATPFRVKIPASFSRLGHIKQQYQITQWFPKPAVYDRAGWHPMPYLDQGEFYYEFGEYNVYITVPKNYVVGATGVLQNNPEEEAFLQEREAESRKIYLLEDLANEKEPFALKYPEDAVKTLHFKQNRVHDFAWFCDKQYLVLSDTVITPNAQRTVKAVVMFNAENRKVWENSVQDVKDAVYWYSKFVGDYPYDHCTAVDGALSAGAGMEYPMITVLGGSNPESLRQVIVHEVGHNWFQGILASNERGNPWQDEGVNSFYEQLVLDTTAALLAKQQPADTSGKGLGVKKIRGYAVPFLGKLEGKELTKLAQNYAAGVNRIQPIQYHSEWYLGINYGIIVYMKTPIALGFLRSYLGSDKFDEAMRGYYSDWQFKHPRPQDLQGAFYDVVGDSLHWFFRDYFAQHQEPDYKLHKAQQVGDSLQLTVSFPKNYKLPVKVAIRGADDSVLTSCWTPPLSGKQTINIPLKGAGETWKSVELNPDQLLSEQFRNNNSLKNSKICPHCKKPAVRFLFSFDDPKRRTLNVLPAIGYNTTDGFMLGALGYHQFFPKKHLEFHVLPTFGFNSNTLAGSTGFTYRFFPKNVLRTIEIKSRVANFGGLFRWQSALVFNLKSPWMRDQLVNQFVLRTHYVGTFLDNRLNMSNGSWPLYSALDYHFYRPSSIVPFGLDVEIGASNINAVRFSVSPYAKIQYHPKGHLSLRAFVGAYVASDKVPTPMLWGLSGSVDPLGQQPLLDRAGSTQLLSQQLVEDNGGFRTLNRVFSNSWLSTLNASVKIPYVPVVQVFGDFGVIETESISATGQTDPLKMHYGAGLALRFLNDALNIYLPITGTVYGEYLPQRWGEFAENISFSLVVNRLLQMLPL